MAALMLLCATAVRGASDEGAATAAAACPSDCLTCDAKRACTSCPATFGLNAAKRCVKCASDACLDCNLNYKRCTRCAFGTNRYIDATGRCQVCYGFFNGGPCLINATVGCNPDGSCQQCDFGYARIKGRCQKVSTGCDASNTLADGSCKACYDGYVRLASGRCKMCPAGCLTCLASGSACKSCFDGFTLQGSKCGQCPSGCANCTGDPKTCRKCQYGGLDAAGRCVNCADPDCRECTTDLKRCTSCGLGLYAKDGKCVTCPSTCDWTCSNDGVCDHCGSGYGRVGKSCVKCKVKRCESCDGSPSKCKLCMSDSAYYSLYPNKDGTVCIRCQAHRKCADCNGSHGACLKCAEGWGVVRGTCQPCQVAGCQNCDGDADKGCRTCASPEDSCYGAWEFDPRTRKCVGVGEPYC